MKVEDLKKYKDGLYSSLSRDLDAFEKNFILISSGILAFSITFIKDIVKIEDAIWLPMLFLGWFLILISIGLMMYAFLSSVNGSNSLWKIVDDYIIQEKLYDSTSNLTLNQNEYIKIATNDELYKVKKYLKRTRTLAIWSFIIGVFFFSAFVALNLYKENNKVEKTSNHCKSNSFINDTIKDNTLKTYKKDSIIIIK